MAARGSVMAVRFQLGGSSGSVRSTIGHATVLVPTVRFQWADRFARFGSDGSDGSVRTVPIGNPVPTVRSFRKRFFFVAFWEPL